jgi:hypothetical protein
VEIFGTLFPLLPPRAFSQPVAPPDQKGLDCPQFRSAAQAPKWTSFDVKRAEGTLSGFLVTINIFH